MIRVLAALWRAYRTRLRFSRIYFRDAGWEFRWGAKQFCKGCGLLVGWTPNPKPNNAVEMKQSAQNLIEIATRLTAEASNGTPEFIRDVAAAERISNAASAIAERAWEAAKGSESFSAAASAFHLEFISGLYRAIERSDRAESALRAITNLSADSGLADAQRIAAEAIGQGPVTAERLAEIRRDQNAKALEMAAQGVPLIHVKKS